MDQVTYNKIKDFLDGNCSDDERQDIIKWITRSKENEKFFSLGRTLFSRKIQATEYENGGRETAETP